ncbi:unnamed protein product [Camellia sinensis]
MSTRSRSSILVKANLASNFPFQFRFGISLDNLSTMGAVCSVGTTMKKNPEFREKNSGFSGKLKSMRSFSKHTDDSYSYSDVDSFENTSQNFDSGELRLSISRELKPSTPTRTVTNKGGLEGGSVTEDLNLLDTSAIVHMEPNATIEEGKGLRNDPELVRSVADKHFDLLRPSARYSLFKGQTTDAADHEKGKYTLIRDTEDFQVGAFDKPLPCFGCGIGWFCFLLGFVFPLMWYYAAFLYFGNYYRKDPRERAGLAASAITCNGMFSYIVDRSIGSFNVAALSNSLSSSHHCRSATIQQDELNRKRQ